jgi:hypothetical protein
LLTLHKNSIMLRFSGHDTFHCKEQWILKGVHLIDNEGSAAVFRDMECIPKLGVGKNMVRSIQHWLRAFGVLEETNDISNFGKSLFLVDKLDPYLENEGSLWLLQYFICKTRYASIYKLIFSDYFLDKATLEFTESQVIKFIKRILSQNKQRPVTDNTLRSDFKVFIKTYVSPLRNDKTVEDDFNAPLLSLNLIHETHRKNSNGENVYMVERKSQPSISAEIFIYCLLFEIEDKNDISLDLIRTTIGSYLCLSNEGIERLIDEVCDKYKEFVYKEDAGIKQLQIKKLNPNFKNNLLKKHYAV